jgi:hypothetical protein
MLNKYVLIGDVISLSFSPNKPLCMAVGIHLKLDPMSLDNVKFQWVSFIKYVGVHMVGG